MNSWIDGFYFFIFGAAILLSAVGMWFTAILPGLDRWSKRFFLCYFAVFMLCCLSTLTEAFWQSAPVPPSVIYFTLALESFFLSIPLPMLTVYLLHCCAEEPRESRLMRAVAGLWALYLLILTAAPFVGGFTIVTQDNQYSRGPLYPIGLLPLVAISIFTLAGTLHRREKLSRKVFHSFLVAIVPMTLTMTVQIFVDVFPLLDISFVLAGLSMYGMVLSDQIEQDLCRQRQIADQRASIMVLQMRPHFIYNTLMSIYSLCNQDPQKARQVTMDFTNYLRKNFNAVAVDSAVPFSAELEHTRAYLAVEQVQYEDMLVVEYDTPFTQFRLPPLTLQPIVENAVKHGMNPYSGPLCVSVRTRQTESGSEIVVEDNGPGFDPSGEGKPQTALENIRQRLESMCGGTLEIAAREGGGTRVTVRIPIKRDASYAFSAEDERKMRA